MSLYEQQTFLDKRARAAIVTSGVAQDRVFMRTEAAYVVTFDETAKRLGFEPVIMPDYAVPVDCIDVTSFERMGLGWDGDVQLPIHEGLCLIADPAVAIDGIDPTKLLYIPYSENELKYDLLANVSARHAAAQGGKS